MDNIKFSIIIPLYNKVSVIADTLQSVLTQDYSQYEIVVVDDGSTDGSAEVVKNLNDRRIRLFQIPNGGVSHARNYGAQQAQNRWLMFLDGDDLFKPGTLNEFARLITKYPYDEVFLAKYVSTDDKKYGGFTGKREGIYENTMSAIWHKRFNAHPGNTVCSKEAFSKTGGFDERMSYYEDWEFGVKLLLQYRVVFTPFVCMEYVVANNEARVRLHPLEKETGYYMESWPIENFWLRNIVYGKLRYFAQRRRRNGDIDGAKIFQNMLDRKYGKYYYFIDILLRLRHKLLRYGI